VNFDEICALIELVAKKGLPLVEVEQDGVKVRIRGAVQTVQVLRNAEVNPVLPAAVHSPAAVAEAAVDPGHHLILSPMVGTFYRAPSPQAEPFVKGGDRVRKGQVLAIIEAMKLMNEIEADQDGEVAAIYPANAQAVEFGEKLFALKV
jgi:acetyl-CoA carboxylase biotin carboxyl carrier protein